MKFSLIICLLFNFLLTFGQVNKIKEQKEVLYFRTNIEDTIKVTGQVPNSEEDTVLIVVEQKKGKENIHLQAFKTLYSFPLEMTKAFYDNKNGILIKYDPSAKYGKTFLYLFDDSSRKLRQIEGFKELGMIFEIKKNRSYYSYISCGCADDCWKSVFFKVTNFRLDTIASLSCDCEHLIEKSNKIETSKKTCHEYNDNEKLDRIKSYWTKKTKNGL